MTGDEVERDGGVGGRAGEESRVGGAVAEKVEREEMEEGEELMDGEAVVMEVQLTSYPISYPNTRLRNSSSVHARPSPKSRWQYLRNEKSYQGSDVFKKF